MKIDNEISRKRKRETEKVTTFKNRIDAYNEKKKKRSKKLKIDNEIPRKRKRETEKVTKIFKNIDAYNRKIENQ